LVTRFIDAWNDAKNPGPVESPEVRDLRAKVLSAAYRAGIGDRVEEKLELLDAARREFEAWETGRLTVLDYAAKRTRFAMGGWLAIRACLTWLQERALIIDGASSDPATSGDGAQTTVEPNIRDAVTPPRLVMNSTNHTIVLDGASYPLTADGFDVFKRILEGGGQYVDSDALRGKLKTGRPDRVIGRFPPTLRSVIDSKRGAGGGYRIDPQLVGTIGP